MKTYLWKISEEKLKKTNLTQYSIFLEKNYNENITIDDAKMLAISTIQNVNEDKNQVDNIKMLQIKSESSEFEFIDDENIKKIAKQAKIKYTFDQK